jgi:phage terminase small subunit
MPDGRPKLIALARGHRTKAEIELREKAEKSLYTGERFHELPQVAASTIAHREYSRLKRLYSKIPFVDALDQQIINQYCLEVDNADNMQKILTQLQLMTGQTDDFDKKLEIFGQINRMQTALRQSKELLLKYGDRLLLNPATRIKSIPKTPVNDKPELTGMARLLASGRPV